MKNQKVLDRIIRECFWEYHFTPQNLVDIASGNQEREQLFLFGKIFENSTDVMKALEIFPEVVLFKLLRAHKISRFNHRLLERRLKTLKYHFLKEQVSIPELEWRIPK